MGDFCDTKTSKNISKFVCINCDFKCSKKGDWNRHIIRPKHINLTSSNNYSDKKNLYTCDICDKIYNSRNGLWNHKKKCNESINLQTNEIIEPSQTNELQELKEFMKYLMKENTEMKNMMFEVIKNGTNNNNNNNTHTNSHNKAFNLNFFLNETCKDAMNITEFVNSIHLQLSDLERVGEIGYVEGISNIIVKSLKELDITQRPVHCTDKKRETMYVKDENAWEKDEEKKKMHKLVKKVADKNIKLLPHYRDKHPDYNVASSLSSDKYNQIFLESLGGSGDNDFEKEERIIKRVSKEVLVDKPL